MYPIRLCGQRVGLRDFRTGDVDDALAIDGDERVTRWLSFDVRNRIQTLAMLEGAILRAQAEPRTEYYLAVTDSGDRLVGFVRLALGGVRAAELGYAVHADHWGRGYATDATRTLIDFAFDTLDLHRITAAVGPENAASIAVVRRLGMRYEGRLRDHVHANGAWRDSLLYSVLAPEWPTVRPEPG